MLVADELIRDAKKKKKKKNWLTQWRMNFLREWEHTRMF